MPEYKFAVAKCGYCGQKLSGKKVELEGMKGPYIAMGRCPQCGMAHTIEPKAEPEPPAEPPETEPEEKPPAEE